MGAPASFYLEEAFEALNFHHDRQELFVLGCLASACLGAASSLHGVRLRQDEYYGQVVHLAQALAVLLSPLLFPANLAGHPLLLRLEVGLLWVMVSFLLYLVKSG